MFGKGSGTRRGPGGSQSPHTEVFLDETSKFQLLTYELSISSSYFIGDFILSFWPTLALPQNPSVVTVDDQSFKEDLDPIFFWSAGVSYQF